MKVGIVEVALHACLSDVTLFNGGRVPQEASQAVQDLIWACLAEDPAARPNAAEVQQKLEALSAQACSFGAPDPLDRSVPALFSALRFVSLYNLDQQAVLTSLHHVCLAPAMAVSL